MSTFRRRLMMSFKKPSSRLPSDYQEVEYIGFGGGQYIDTGVSPSTYNGNYKIEIEERHSVTTENKYIIGTLSQNNANNSRGNIRINAGGVSCIAYVNTANNSGALNLTLNDSLNIDSKNYIKFDADTTNAKREFQVNSYNTSASGAFVSKSTQKFRLGGLNGGTTQLYIGDIYSVKIYGNGTLVREFIPCYKKSGTVIGFYDLQNDVFYTNKGTGNFTKGADV